MYTIVDNKYDISPDLLFGLGKRDGNTKRSFLFLSKLLGKHLAVNPDVVKATGFLLSSLKYGFDNRAYISCIKENIRPTYDQYAQYENVLVIGFCETATALGMSVAASIPGAHYICTTREPLSEMRQLLNFQEPHSHASTHCLYSDTLILDDFKEMVLVDDEITTGRSLINLIREIVNQSCVKVFSVMTILDWRNEEMREMFETVKRELGIEIKVYSLLSGCIQNEDHTEYKNTPFVEVTKPANALSLQIFPRMDIRTADDKITSYVQHLGRWGISYDEIQQIEELAYTTAQSIKPQIQGCRSLLVLGHGENIYIPSRVAAYLQEMGFDVQFKTTSRTPIYCDQIYIHEGLVFDDRGTKYHFYNKTEAETLDRVIMLADTPFQLKICENIIVFNL